MPTPKSSVRGLSTISQGFIEEAELLDAHVCVLSRGRLLDCSSPGSSVLWIFQARIKWVSISYSRGPSQFDRTRVSRLRHWQAASFPLHHLGSSKYLINICANCQKLPGCCWSLTSQMNYAAGKTLGVLNVCSERRWDLRSDLCSPTTSLSSSGSRPKPSPPVPLKFESSIMLTAVTLRKPSGLGF